MKRAMAFIDGGGFHQACRERALVPPLDLVAMAREAVGRHRDLIRVYYYNARSDENLAEKEFYDYLRRADYCTVRLGRPDALPLSDRQKGAHILLTQDMLTLAFQETYDVALVITDDGDLAPPMEQIKTLGKEVDLAFLGADPGPILREACDRYVDLLKVCNRFFR